MTTSPLITQTIRPWANREPCCKTQLPHITTTNLSVSYNGKLAIDHVNLPINRGCITTIIGPSGCGKSTFLSCLNRMTDLATHCKVSGSIAFNDTDITNPKINLIALRRQIGMNFQRPNPPPLSIQKNLTFPLKQHGIKRKADRVAKAQTILRRVGLWDEVKDRLQTPALRLSGGQQQRLCIARALVLSPEVLLLDEPCSALDPIASGVVEDLITSLRGQYTVVVVTHNLAQARRIADNVAMFWMLGQAGTIIEHSPVAPMFESPQNEITAAYLRGERG
ncbi:MAG: phosphate ABC transporter ATP-binding protein [Phycisphaeraceae bacterium]|nr:phosphate ABC transporter ATP-binding protein [Phycisphaeraceae bacterium]